MLIIILPTLANLGPTGNLRDDERHCRGPRVQLRRADGIGGTRAEAAACCALLLAIPAKPKGLAAPPTPGHKTESARLQRFIMVYDGLWCRDKRPLIWTFQNDFCKKQISYCITLIIKPVSHLCFSKQVAFSLTEQPLNHNQPG